MLTDQDIPGFTAFAGDRICRCFRIIFLSVHEGIIFRLVQRRADIVAHTAVHECVKFVRCLFDIADLVEIV